MGFQRFNFQVFFCNFGNILNFLRILMLRVYRSLWISETSLMLKIVLLGSFKYKMLYDK